MFFTLQEKVQEKLRSLGMPSGVSDLFLVDIFGQCHGSTYQEGLVTAAVSESSVRPFKDCRSHVNAVKNHMRQQVVLGFMSFSANTKLMW